MHIPGRTQAGSGIVKTASKDFQRSVKIGDFYGIFCCRRTLLQVSGQPAVTISLCPEGLLNAPAQRQRREPNRIRGTV
jgi:hypothetical protein